MQAYTVKAGDTLGAISERFYGAPIHYLEIAGANNITNPDNIAVGEVLVIPDLEESKSADYPVSKLHHNFLSEAEVQLILPLAASSNIHKYLNHLNEKMPEFKINTPLRICHFIAQIGHESASFKYNTENLNYSAQALQSVFNHYFPTSDLAEACARQPEKIANRVYANRMHNGDEASGDGWRYRGRGLIQLTGRENYALCSKSLQLDLVNNPALLATDPVMAVQGAGWYWQSMHLNILADMDDIKGITKVINGGDNGLADREAILARAKEILM